MRENTPRWKVTVHGEALPEVREVKIMNAHAFERVFETMELLSKEEDPRTPQNPRLNVCALKWDAPTWYRVRVLGVNWRVVFRVLEQRNGVIKEVRRYQKLHERVDGRAIQVTAATSRAEAYGAKLRKLYRKVS